MTIAAVVADQFGRGGLTAMVKAQAGIVFDECARCAVLLFGGNGFTKGGQGDMVERACAIHPSGWLLMGLAGLYREVPGARIPGEPNKTLVLGCSQ